MRSLTDAEIIRFWNEALAIEPEITGLAAETIHYWIVQRGLTPEEAAKEMLQPRWSQSA